MTDTYRSLFFSGQLDDLLKNNKNKEGLTTKDIYLGGNVDKNRSNAIIQQSQGYKTQNWDMLLLKETQKFEDDIYLMWFDDGVKKKEHANFPIVSRKWYETLGYFTPGCFNFGFNDTWLFEIGLYVKRAHYVDTVKIDHNNFKQDKKYWDSTYARNRTEERGNLYEKDRDIWLNSHYDRIKEALKLINVIENANNS